jgi:hypothetical protein
MLEEMKKKVEVDIDGIKEATNRSRTVFLLYSLACLVIFMGIWNAEWSWQRHMNISDPGHEYNKYWKTVGIDSSVLTESTLRSQYAKLYYDRQYVSIPVLGISTTSSDFTISAPICMLIFITWFFFSTRRENHTVLEVRRDFDKITHAIQHANESTKWKILLHTLYAGTVQHFIWTTATRNDVRGVDPKNETNAFVTNWIGRGLSTFMHWLPLLILLFVSLEDLIEVRTQSSTKLYFNHLQGELLALNIFNLSCALIVATQLYYIGKNRRAIKHTLGAMAAIIDSRAYDYEIDMIPETPPTVVAQN